MSVRYRNEYRWGSDYQDRHFKAFGRRHHSWGPISLRRVPLPRNEVLAVHEVQRCQCGAERASLLGTEHWRIIDTGRLEVPDDFYPPGR